jgi:hypothetical protein
VISVFAIAALSCSDESSATEAEGSDASLADGTAGSSSGLDASSSSIVDVATSSDAVLDSLTGPLDGSEGGSACRPDKSALECGAPQACGPVVEPVVVMGAKPLPQGGTIVDGTYELRAMAAFLTAGSTNAMFQETRVFSQGTMSVTLNSPQTRVTSGSYSVSGTTITLTTTCPVDAAETSSFDYTVISDTIILYEPITNGTLALSHVRIP